jgi:hypothetical protein
VKKNKNDFMIFEFLMKAKFLKFNWNNETKKIYITFHFFLFSLQKFHHKACAPNLKFYQWTVKRLQKKNQNNFYVFNHLFNQLRGVCEKFSVVNIPAKKKLKNLSAFFFSLSCSCFVHFIYTSARIISSQSRFFTQPLNISKVKSE